MIPVERVGLRQYRVGAHWVDLNASEAAGVCSCGDYLWKNHRCKHIQAAESAEHDSLMDCRRAISYGDG